MGFESKYGILNLQVIYIENSNLNIADMWLITLDRVTYVDSAQKKKKIHSMSTNKPIFG